MSSLYKSFQTSPDLELKGVILDFGENGKIRIARAGGNNERFQKRLMEVSKPHRQSIRSQTMDAKTMEKLMAEVYADTVILGWEGIKDANDADIAFSRENVIKLLTDLPDFFAEIQKSASDMTFFRQAEVEADSKN